MPAPPKPSPPKETRDLILNAAGPIFARRGFHATSVREITRAAGVNLAAINYHFGDKQELYVQTLMCAHHAAVKMVETTETGKPKEKLRDFIRRFLGHLLDPSRPDWHGQLIAREMAQPSAALDRLVEESIRPIGERIQAIVREIMDKNTHPTRVRRACFSVIGQCLYYVHCREMIVRIFPTERGVPHDIDALAEHIFQFSRAGIAAINRLPATSSPRKSK
jgi:AcrR family transcriptional regulator